MSTEDQHSTLPALALIDIASAQDCRNAAIEYMRVNDDHKRSESIRAFISDCERFLAGDASYGNMFPHGAESTFLYLAYG